MPSAVSNQNNYYAAHQRRQSSQSQTNLPDQIRNSSSQAQSPNRSLVFLPSTAYSQPESSIQRPRTPSLSAPSKSSSKLDLARSDDIPPDPHDFYRQYQDPFTNGSPVALHQEAIRTAPLDPRDEVLATVSKSGRAASPVSEAAAIRRGSASGPSRKLSLNTQTLPDGSYDNIASRSSSAVPHTLRSRKASFKDLVARFDASPEEVPPLPTQQISRPGSRTASPMPYAPMDTSHSYQPQRSGSRLAEAKKTGFQSASISVRGSTNDKKGRARGASSAGLSQVVSNPEVPAAGRKLLFGEVVFQTSDVPAAAGYGISNARRRRGSEGSPMHSPNPMFPSSRVKSPKQGESISHTSIHTQSTRQVHIDGPSAAAGPRSLHRRANSDFTGPSYKTLIRDGQTPSPTGIARLHRLQADPTFKPTTHSRIPVSTRHQRMASDSAAISPTSQPTLVPLPLLRAHESGQTPLNPLSSGSRKPPSPQRVPDRPPAPIKSPGRRGRGTATANGEKSPSLRANIIAPPPKISPPLRSSRPRMPVSSATTAASRAKMAEKFQTMAKQQSDKKSFRRQRPPELDDIDLKARRLKITQALSRSKEGQDLKGAGVEHEAHSGSQTDVPNSSSDEPDGGEVPLQERSEIPAVVVNEPDVDTSVEDAFYKAGNESVQDQRAFTQNALKVVEGNTSHLDQTVDSLTLGNVENALGSLPFKLNTQLLPPRDGEEPYSAATEGTVTTEATEATIIDVEPQTDATHLQTPSQSLFNQITTLRNQSSTSPLSAISQMSGENSDHAEKMSVHLLFRETTYLDDQEALEKGYRPFAEVPQPDLTPSRSDERDSWTSSIEDDANSVAGDIPSSELPSLSRPGSHVAGGDAGSHSESEHSSIHDGSSKELYASDAYTIVNKVLQQQSPSGVVDQQLVDDIYHRIIQAAPDLADAENVNEEKVLRLCLQELEDYANQWDQLESSHSQYFHSDTIPDAADESIEHESDEAEQSVELTTPHHVPPPPPQSYRSHRYKSSLDSAEDWAETSPSVGDWIQFALKSPAEHSQHRQPSGLAHEEVAGEDDSERPTEVRNHGIDGDQQAKASTYFVPIGAEVDFSRPPSHSPPPPPVSAMPSIDQTSWSAPVGIRPATVQASLHSRPPTSLSQLSARSSLDQHVMQSSSSAARPSVHDQSPEQRRLKHRRHVLKELVDTEYSYERDMRVLCDIYKQTAVAAIGEEDIKIVFGNVDLVQQFSKDFLALLKQVVKPAYVMDKSDRRKDGNRTSTLQSSTMSMHEFSEMTDSEKDEVTRVGNAFEASMTDMERVYTDYICTRHAANKRLEVLQSSSAVREWLKECSENSTDITNAWSLDALLVKPIQRITKYPLLLNQLLDATPDTHPDIEFIRRAALEVTEVNVRINEVKKHTELVDQVLNRKRKESDVRNGLTKAFGRRAEKLRQHVGINEIYEDPEYAKIKISYDNNIAHLFLVTKDCQGYVEEISKWVNRLCELAAAAEAWVDVGHTNHSQLESKLRQFAIVVRGINSIALPDHIDQITRRVLQPMEKTATMLEKFKTDSKGLIQKREKRLLDYNQYKNKKDKGERIDKKMTERMEQWEALNLEAKERMKRLLKATADMVHSCQANLIQLHLSWLAMFKQKFSAAMEIPLDKLDIADVVKDWQEDFDFHEATALSLSICNGSLLAEAVNMVSFLTPGTTLTGEDSPRQPSWNSGAKRSISMNNHDESSPLPVTEHHYRNSGGPMSSQAEEPRDWSSPMFLNGRLRTSSAASGRTPKTPETGSRGVTGSIYTVNSTTASRPGTSPGHSEDSSRPAPRLSLEAPSPSLGPLLTESPMAARHISTSTFYSATPEPSHSQPHLLTSRGSVFSSAMPMEDGPEPDSTPEDPAPRSEPGVLFTAASVYEFNIDRSRQQGGFRYLTYVAGEIFDIIAEHGELWLAINQDDPAREIGWIWNKHFAKLAE